MANRRWLCAVLGCSIGFWLACGLQSGAQQNGSWRAASSNAKTITGDVLFSGERITINFSSFPAAQIRTLKPEEANALFEAGDNAGGRGNLYRVDIPAAKQFLRHNTLCGSEDTQWIVTYATGKSLQLAFFSGTAMPVLTADALANATSLCGIFSYSR
jgi:hypothetical protein